MDLRVFEIISLGILGLLYSCSFYSRCVVIMKFQGHWLFNLYLFLKGNSYIVHVEFGICLPELMNIVVVGFLHCLMVLICLLAHLPGF